MTEKKKIKLLLIVADHAGIGSIRFVWPGQEMINKFSDQFDVELNITPDYNDIEYFKQFDIIHFHRQFGDIDKVKSTFKILQDNGTIMVMDLDDNFDIQKSHPFYAMAVKEDIATKTKKLLTLVNAVTSTTHLFQKFLKQYNQNVIIMKNGIDPAHWKDENTQLLNDNRLRIGYAGGSSHHEDLKLIKDSMTALHNDKELIGKYQIVMCGYDVRGQMNMVDDKGNIINSRKMLPSESIWNRFEEILTDNYNPNIISPEYQKWLKRYKNEPYPFGDIRQEFYIKRWTLPLSSYPTHYNHFDVSLAPLVDNSFNLMKSELKISEAGMKKKVIVAQDFGIYKDIIRDGENGFLVNYKDKLGWYKILKKLILNRELVNKVSNTLYEEVKDIYTMENLTKIRVQEYLKMIEKRDAKFTENNTIEESVVSSNV
jgi:glycosyltransferase involved in cell wall biosynthesis